MKWVTDFWNLPMVWDIIIPIGIAIVFALLLVWDSRLPPERRALRRLRKRR